MSPRPSKRSRAHTGKGSRSGKAQSPWVVGDDTDGSEVRADLLVIGNVGLSSVAGRLLGSVPSEVSRKAKTDVLIVHTID